MSVAQPAKSTMDITRMAALLMGYIVASASMIRFNKFLMHPDRFPHSLCLTSCHMSMSFLMCLTLYALRPSLFPGVAGCKDQAAAVMGWMAPMGVAFAVSLYTSNEAYLYCSVSFLQFMKEGNIIITFLMSCAVGLQALNRLRVAVIIWIIVGACASVTGELHFAFVGFAFQLVSQVAECVRSVMGEIVLGGSGLKLDPLSYTLFVAPTCLVVLLVGTSLTWTPAIPTQMGQWWPLIIPNCMLACVLNVLVASIIKEVSAVGFVLLGVSKDTVLVLLSCAYFHEVVTFAQACGFIVTLSGVFFWAYLKAAPSSPTALRAMKLLQMPMPTLQEGGTPDERTALTMAAGKL